MIKTASEAALMYTEIMKEVFSEDWMNEADKDQLVGYLFEASEQSLESVEQGLAVGRDNGFSFETQLSIAKQLLIEGAGRTRAKHD